MKNGVALALLSSLVFSVMNALVKEASADIPAAEIAFFRGVIGTLLIMLLMRRSGIALSRKGVPMLLLRGAMGGLYMLAFFYTVSRMPLTDASILAQTSPLFVLLLSALFLRERLHARVKGYVLLIMAGAFVILNPLQYGSFSWPALVGLAGAMFSAAASLSIRYLSRTHPAYEIVFYFTAASALISLPFMWSSFVVPNLRTGLLLLVIGIVSLLGQLFLTKAFTHENAVVVQMVSYSGLMMNALLGMLIWGELPGWLTLAGGIMIIAGSIGVNGGRKQGVSVSSGKPEGAARS
ncbi:DMT family transporter [Paenibacillus sp. SYP-B4298]|uniref:DMT family transporter n=1 Tax=Paenibacillus sp. SYP-B4298 TaxID=2996034 RepID=UPI0022DE1F72|nr:DMT family transporter [Paenibacillus sp. SYP-B4298]